MKSSLTNNLNKSNKTLDVNTKIDISRLNELSEEDRYKTYNNTNEAIKTSTYQFRSTAKEIKLVFDKMHKDLKILLDKNKVLNKDYLDQIELNKKEVAAKSDRVNQLVGDANLDKSLKLKKK